MTWLFVSMKMSKKPMKIGRPSRRHSWAGRLGEWGREDRPSDGAEWTGSPWIASENELALGEDSVAKRCGVYVQLPQVLPRSCQVYLWGNVFVTLFKPNRAVAPPTAATGRRFWRLKFQGFLACSVRDKDSSSWAETRVGGWGTGCSRRRRAKQRTKMHEETLSFQVISQKCLSDSP